MSGAITAAVVVGGAAIGAAAISADSARKASNQQADAIAEGRKVGSNWQNQARKDVIARVDPALENYATRLQLVQGDLKTGATDIMTVLQEATGRANEILSQTGIDAQHAIMGTKAVAQGTPIQQFEQDYNQFVQAGTREAAPRSLSDALKALNSAGLAPDDYQIAMRDMEAAATPEQMQQVLSKHGVTYEPGYSLTEGAGAAIPDRGIPGGETVQMMRQPDGSYAPGQPTDVATTPQTGFLGATGQLERGLQMGLGQLQAGTETAREDITLGEQAALGRFEPYSTAGRSAIEQEAALSGAMGPEAQQAAIDAFMESPGQKYLREQQEKALLRNQAAIGGLGGGNVRSALQEQAMGIASTQQQQYLENLRSIAGRGQDVAGQEAGIIGGAASQRAQLAQQLGMTEADLTRMSTSDLAQLAQQTGMQLADLQRIIGGQQAQSIAGLGGDIAGVMGSTLGDIAGMGERSAQNVMTGELDQATKLANIAVGAGSQQAEMAAQQGSALAAGTAATGKAWQEGLQGLGSAAAYGMSNYSPTPTTGWAPAGNPTTDLKFGQGMSR